MLIIEARGEEWSPNYWVEASKQFDKDLHRLLERWKTFLVAEAKRRAPKLTGRLRAGIIGYVDHVVNAIILENHVLHAYFQEFGTGLYSEFGAKEEIRPVRTRALKVGIGRYRSARSAPSIAQAFEATPGKVRAGSAFIFRASVKGSRPIHLFTDLIAEYEADITNDVLLMAEKHGFR